jgi:hypothetical protein
MPDVEKTPQQLNLFAWAWRAVVPPAKPSPAPITFANVRLELRVCQVTQLSPAYTAREHELPANL